jgi:hypothetical protein
VFEQRGHMRPELASPTFIPALHRALEVTEVDFPEDFRREHLFLFHLRKPLTCPGRLLLPHGQTVLKAGRG